MDLKDYLFTDSAGVRHYLDFDEAGPVRIQSFQDVDDILDANKAKLTHNDGYSPTRELRRVATIPASVRLKWLLEEGWDAFRPDLYADRLMRKLNDPEFAFLRTAPGRLGVTNGVMR